jgi:SAM-dependent methyltransferase
MPAISPTSPVQVDADTALAVGAPATADATAWGRYYEDVYHDAGHDASRIPWADLRPCPSLQAWLNTEAPSHLRPGATACVVGCGLGDDVKELADRGYDAMGFDVSATAVQWARSRHAELSDRLAIADLFDLPASLRRRWDLVVEVNTLQALHPDLRARAAAGIVQLARPRGLVLTICRGRDASQPLPGCPPFALSPEELESLFASQAMAPVRAADDFQDDETPPVRRLRCCFKRG